MTRSTHYFYEELLAAAQLAAAGEINLGLSIEVLSYLLFFAPEVAEA